MRKETRKCRGPRNLRATTTGLAMGPEKAPGTGSPILTAGADFVYKSRL